MTIWIDGPGIVRYPYKTYRVVWPFERCHRSKKWLFLQKAYFVSREVDYDPVGFMVLSEKEFLIASLKGEFDEHQI